MMTSDKHSDPSAKCCNPGCDTDMAPIYEQAFGLYVLALALSGLPDTPEIINAIRQEARRITTGIKSAYSSRTKQGAHHEQN